MDVVVGADQKVLGMANVALGSTAPGGAGDLNVFPCYKGRSGGLVTDGAGIFGLKVAPDTRITVGISRIFIGLALDEYEVGMCGYSGSAADWNFNDNGWQPTNLREYARNGGP